MTKTITITNQKGGTGKTSTSLFLAYGLVQRGSRVLLVDLDQQADASVSMNTRYNSDKTIFEVLTNQLDMKDIIIPVNLTLNLAPASSKLAQLDVLLFQQDRYKADLLKEALTPIKANYDYIIIDTPPALSMVITNALTASDYVLIPVQADFFSLKGLSDLTQTIAEVQHRTNPKLKVAGILIDRFNSRTVYSNAVANMLEEVASKLDTHVFNSKIREAISIKEAQHEFKSIFDYDKHGKVTQDINSFIDELLKEI